MSDSIGDFLTVIRNAAMKYKRFIVVPYSREKVGIATVLKEEGFIKDFQKVEAEKSKPELKVFLKYVNGESVIHYLKRVSTPGRRRYEGIRDIKPVIGGLGISIVSTSKGIMSDKEALQKSVGGEIICHVW